MNTLTEVLFPIRAQCITNHLNLHLIDTIEKCGPQRMTNMMRDERAGGQVAHCARGTKHLEASMVSKYLVRELCSFLRAHDPSIFSLSSSDVLSENANLLLPSCSWEEYANSNLQLRRPKLLDFRADAALFDAVKSYYSLEHNKQLFVEVQRRIDDQGLLQDVNAPHFEIFWYRMQRCCNKQI